MAGNGREKGTKHAEKAGGQGNSPEDLTPGERAYYRATWGYDPVTDRLTSLPLEDVGYPDPAKVWGWRRAKVLYHYEALVPLEHDPELQAAGVTLLFRKEKKDCPTLVSLEVGVLAVIGHDDAEIDEQVLAKVAILDLGIIDHPADVLGGRFFHGFIENDAKGLLGA